MNSPARRDARYTRGYLPHVRLEGRTYSVTFRLEGTFPREVLLKYREERNALILEAQRSGHQLSWAEQKRLFDLHSERIESYLDAGRGDCWLKRPGIAKLVVNALQFFDKERYELGPWVVMPNHVHVMVRPLGEHLLEEIVQSWKGFTGREANTMLRQTGQRFWAREYFDHWLRDDAEGVRLSAYIHDNPCKAGLCGAPEEWPWSSAHPQWRTASLKGSEPAG